PRGQIKLMRLILLLILISFNCFGQKTFDINKTETDSTDLKEYKIFSVSENVDINFVNRQIPKSKRFRLTREEAITADKLFREQYVKATVDQYRKQFINPDQYSEGSAEFEKAKQTYQNTYKRIESNAKKESKKKISKY